MEIYCDGSCWPNPGGEATFAWVAREGGDIVGTGSGRITASYTSNNVAEYHGVIDALKWAAAMGHYRPTVYTDSQLIARQISGKTRCRKPHLEALRDQARGLVRQTRAEVVWVPREENAEADVLADEARTVPMG